MFISTRLKEQFCVKVQVTRPKAEPWALEGSIDGSLPPAIVPRPREEDDLGDARIARPQAITSDSLSIDLASALRLSKQ